MGEFSNLTERLDEILAEVRRKDISLEKSMELFDEALELGNRAAELVDVGDGTDADGKVAADAKEASA